jgi:hypothetical protein
MLSFKEKNRCTRWRRPDPQTNALDDILESFSSTLLRSVITAHSV